MRKINIAIIIGISFLIGLVLFVGLSSKVNAYTPHDPIRIDSNNDFDANHGVNSGSGTKFDPWIIENWGINGSNKGYCIYIGNTTDYFVVRNCYLHNASGDSNVEYSSNSGIYLYNVENGTINNNILCFNQRYGVHLHSSSQNSIYNNTAKNNHWGISLNSGSNSNTIYNNTVHSNEELGISLFRFCQSNNIFNNIAWKNEKGIYVYLSDQNNIFTNNIYSNEVGIHLRESNEHNISNNIITLNKYYGIYLESSNNNIITNSTLTGNNNVGIYLFNSNTNAILENNFSLNRYAIEISFSEKNTLTKNIMLESGIIIMGNKLEQWNTHSIDTSNTVNGKPIYFWKNQSGGTIPIGAGEVILANCKNVKVINQSVCNSSVGIELAFSSNITIINNNVSNNNIGLSLYYSNNNLIVNNTISYNNHYGIHIFVDSQYNRIYNNTFYFNNGARDVYNSSQIQATDRTGNNYWNNTKGHGNLWSDWTSPDNNADGIVDYPYAIEGGESYDYYPLTNVPTTIPKENEEKKSLLVQYSWAIIIIALVIIVLIAGNLFRKKTKK